MDRAAHAWQTFLELTQLTTPEAALAMVRRHPCLLSDRLLARAASAFFQVLYAQLTAGKPTVDAFTDAQRETRVRYPAFRDWGAFILLGE
jgi:hypothetical protein